MFKHGGGRYTLVRSSLCCGVAIIMKTQSAFLPFGGGVVRRRPGQHQNFKTRNVIESLFSNKDDGNNFLAVSSSGSCHDNIESTRQASNFTSTREESLMDKREEWSGDAMTAGDEESSIINDSTVSATFEKQDGGLSLMSSLWTSGGNDFQFSLSVLLLNLVAIIWGTQHAIIKSVLTDSDAASFTLVRFTVAALIASRYTPGLENIASRLSEGTTGKSSEITKASTTWRWGAELGVWMFLGFAFQAIGLEFTTAQKSGFLLYLNVKFVPFLARILFGREISVSTWLSAFTAFFGTALLAWGSSTASPSDNAAAITPLNFNIGDAWSIAAAMASAMFILRMERASTEVPDNAAGLNAACLWVVTALAAAWSIFGGVQAAGTISSDSVTSLADTTTVLWGEVVHIINNHGWELIYLGGVATALANFIQTKAQRDISAERASVIYAMDPVYGACFSYLLLGETLGSIQGWVGAGLVTIAAATNAFLDLSPNEPETVKDETSVEERDR